MRLRHIEVFQAVYASGSISGAARELNVSQPSVSKVLKHAEDQLGFQLFRRSKGRLTPTDEAHALSREVREVFDRLESLKLTASSLRAREGGHIRLAVLPSLGLSVAPEAVARFRQTHPGVTFEVQTLHHDGVLRALYERECDLAVAYDPADHPRLATTRLGRGQLVLLFPAGEFGAEPPERLSLEVLEGRDYIGTGVSSPVSRTFSAEVERLGMKMREVVSVGTFYIAAPLVRSGVGVAVVDEYTARASVGPELLMRPFDPPLSFGVWGIHLEDRPLSHLTQSFLQTLRETLTEAAGS